MNIRALLPLFKLRICSLITFSAIVGLIATQPGAASLSRMVFLVVATMLAAASASAFNHYFDSDIDGMMTRTRRRPLPSGSLAGSRAVLLIAAVLFLLSILVSTRTLNYMVSLHLGLGAFVYAVIYTAWLKRRSWLNIVIGGLAGSFAVLAGGASAVPGLCMPPVLLAVIMFFWTPSHFWSFAIYHREDYARAGVPMLPVVIGESRTALYILINTALLVLSSLVPFFMGHAGRIYFAAAAALGGYFLFWNIKLFVETTRDLAWKNFKISMLYLGGLFVALIIDKSL